MRSYYYKLICVIVLCSMSLSCKKYLDVVPDAVGSLDYAFRNRNEAENYLFACYATLTQMNDVIYDPGFVTSSEIVYVPDFTFHFFNEAGFNIVRGQQTSGNPSLDYWGGRNGGKNLFQAIRRCNIMLENIDKPIDLTASEKKRWIAEVKFLKAYYHYYMIRMYGPILLIKDNNVVNASVADVRRKRASVDDSFAYVVSLLNEAIPDLPPVIENQATEFGRITKSIAMSVKAEVLTTAASPLFNGNPDYANIKDHDGNLLFPASYDANKWKLAADACKEAITECEAQGAHLYNTPPTIGVGVISDQLKQVLTLQQMITGRWEENPELIWALNYTFGYQGFAMPKLTDKSESLGSTYPGTFSVPIATSELYYTKNGVPMNEDKTFDYTNRYSLQAAGADDSHYIALGYTTAKEHFNRELRFYASIGFDGAIWFGNGKGRSNESDLYHIEARGPYALAGPKSASTTNFTGIWPKKLASYLSVMDDGFTQDGFHLPRMRLSGLYLLYAEALNESQGPVADVYTYVDKVRARAGLDGVQNSWANFSKTPDKPGTKEGMREIIHRERRIELCFEGQAGWDLRRWKELQGVLSRPVQGWNVNESDAANFYRPQTLFLPVFGLKDYLWPIQSNDIVVDNNLTQNPYW